MMVNVIGDEQPVASLDGDIHIHSYHKEARPNRKLGHVTIVAENDSILNASSRPVLEALLSSISLPIKRSFIRDRSLFL